MLTSYLVQVLYPLGLIANLFFGCAFTVQWLSSEKRGQAHAPNVFWVLSSIGACLMIIHGFIQNQFPIALLHSANLIIYFRNLNIHSSHRLSFKSTLGILALTLFTVTALFALATYIYADMKWMATPNIFHLPLPPPNLYWHGVGCLGLFIFASRFFIQWCYVEIKHHSSLPTSFWLVGFCGGLLAFLYFTRTGDPVNMISYGSGLLPSLANLRIIYKKKRIGPVSHSCFLSAGEASGDTLGSHLIDTIKSSYPDIPCFGVGGPLMRAKGLRPVLRMEEFQVSGFFEILLSVFDLFRKYRKLYKTILRENPQTVICIDFPDFHFLLIRKLRKSGYQGKIVHYVCPSIWAWRKKRKKTLEKYLDVLLLILPFEKDLFSDSPLQTVYVGHPLVNTCKQFQYCDTWKQSITPSSRPIIAVFPGSRPRDVIRNLPVQIRAFQSSPLVHTHQLLVSSSHTKLDTTISKILKQENCEHSGVVPSSLRYQLMHACDFALAKCGTIVLETALHQTPTIVTCLLGRFDRFIARYVFKILLPSYSLPNIITRSVLFPEFIGGEEDFHYEELAAAIALLNNPEKREEQKTACKKLFDIMDSNTVSPEQYLHFILQKDPHSCKTELPILPSQGSLSPS